MEAEILIKLDDLEDDEDDNDTLWATTNGHVFELKWLEYHWRDRKTEAVLVVIDSIAYLRLPIVERFS